MQIKMKRKAVSLALAIFMLGGVGTNIPMSVSANNDVVEAHSIESSDVSVVKITDSELADMGIIINNNQRGVESNKPYEQYLIDFNNGYVAVDRIYDDEEVLSESRSSYTTREKSAVRNVYLKVLGGTKHEAVITLTAKFMFNGSEVEYVKDSASQSGKTPDGGNLNTYNSPSIKPSSGNNLFGKPYVKATLSYKYGMLQSSYDLYLTCDANGNFSSNYEVK